MMSLAVIIDLVDELATAVVMADPTDKSSLKNIKLQLEKLSETLKHTDHNHITQFGEDFTDFAKNITKCNKKNTEDILGKLNDKIVEWQRALREEQRIMRAVPRESQLNPPAISTKRQEQQPELAQVPDQDLEIGTFELPPWVEEEVFREFIANQKHVLEEIEIDILGLERGEAKKKADLRRKIHTLKGEAGLLGLEDLEYVAHQVEDCLDGSGKVSDRVDALLKVKDWIAQAIVSYAEMALPDLTGKELIFGLRLIVDSCGNDEKEEDRPASPSLAWISTPVK